MTQFECDGKVKKVWMDTSFTKPRLTFQVMEGNAECLVSIVKITPDVKRKIIKALEEGPK